MLSKHLQINTSRSLEPRPGAQNTLKWLGPCEIPMAPPADAPNKPKYQRESREFQQHSCDELEKGNPYISTWEHRIKGKKKTQKKQKIKIPFSVSSLWFFSVTLSDRMRSMASSGQAQSSVSCKDCRVTWLLGRHTTAFKPQARGQAGFFPSSRSLNLSTCVTFLCLYFFLRKWSLAPITYFNKNKDKYVIRINMFKVLGDWDVNLYECGEIVEFSCWIMVTLDKCFPADPWIQWIKTAWGLLLHEYFSIVKCCRTTRFPNGWIHRWGGTMDMEGWLYIWIIPLHCPKISCI